MTNNNNPKANILMKKKKMGKILRDGRKNKFERFQEFLEYI